MPRPLEEITPFEKRGLYWFKRDDLFEIGGMRGSKARAMWFLAQDAGAKGIITSGTRQSTQLPAAARVAAALNIPCRLHVPSGPTTPELAEAIDVGATTIIVESPGYGSVLAARAERDARQHPGWLCIPYRMLAQEIVDFTARQVEGLPDGVNRIVVSIGSGVTLAGILWGLRAIPRPISILGVRVGSDPTRALDKYAPHVGPAPTIIHSSLAYSAAVPITFEGIDLDPYYEAKCVPVMQPGDCLWIAGRRNGTVEAA